MRVKLADFEHLEAPIKVALVDSGCTKPENGDSILKALGRHFPTVPAMLVSVESNGFRAHAYFPTHRLLALLQLEQLTFTEFDLDRPVPEPELPF